FQFGNLMTTGCSCSDQRVTGLHFSNGREEPAFRDGNGYVVVAASVAKGACHAATPRIEIDDLRIWNSGKKRDRGRQQSERFLMAMAVEQDATRGRSQRQVELC